MVERGRLEICCTFRGTEGSNPSLSAIQSGLCRAISQRLTNSLRIQEVKSSQCLFLGSNSEPFHSKCAGVYEKFLIVFLAVR